MSLQFYTNYKHDEKKRLAFNQLALDTFSIDFDSWYRRNMWNDNYNTYSFFDHDQCVANASYNLMTLVIDGELTKGIQIGTVMTHPDYRARGLAQKLIEKIIDDTKETCELYFLCAEDAASSLYKRCGFNFRTEYTYLIELNNYITLDTPLKPISVSPEELTTLKFESAPLSNYLSVIDDIHVAHFYYHLGFNQMIYRPKADVYVIFEIEDQTLLLYELYAKEKITVEEIIPLITPKDVTTIKCLFTPEPTTKGLKKLTGNKDWMVRPNPKIIPDGYKFPIISRT